MWFIQDGASLLLSLAPLWCENSTNRQQSKILWNQRKRNPDRSPNVGYLHNTCCLLYNLFRRLFSGEHTLNEYHLLSEYNRCSCTLRKLITFTASLHLFMNFQHGWITHFSLSTSWSVDFFGMRLWRGCPHFINAGASGQGMYQMAWPICSLPFGQVD